MKKIWKSN